MPYVAGSQTFNDGDVGHDVMRWPHRHVAVQTKRKSECPEICGEVTAKIGMSTHLSLGKQLFSAQRYPKKRTVDKRCTIS